MSRLALLCALISAPGLYATAIDFGGGGTTGFTSGGLPSIVVSNAAGISGLTVTVTATVLSPDSCNNVCWVNSSATGYGVDNSGGAGNDSSTDIDGSGFNDALVILFSQSVRLTGVTFGNWDGGDSGTWVNVTTNTSTAISGATLSGLNSVGTQFRFEATASAADYRVRQITFDVLTPTPEPASFAMLGAGLVALGLLRRRITR